MRLLTTLALVLLLGYTQSSLAEDTERAAVLAVADKIFAAVHTQNPDDFRAFQLAEGSVLTFRPDPSGEPEKLQLRMSSNQEFLAGMKEPEHDYREFWTSEPTVLIRGPIAVVWGTFEFTIDGNFSHCGVNAIDMAKVDGEWKVVNIMWTTEKQDCPVSRKS